MAARPFAAKDYAAVSAWWTAHKWPAIPQDCLPKTGFIVDGLAAGFLYRSDSSICWLEWIIGNPQSDKLLRNEALDQVIAALICEAQRLGARMIFTSVVHPRLIERYQKHGFIVSESGMTNLVRSL